MISSVVVDMMKMRSVQHLLEPILEPLIRKVVSVPYVNFEYLNCNLICMILFYVLVFNSRF